MSTLRVIKVGTKSNLTHTVLHPCIKVGPKAANEETEIGLGVELLHSTRQECRDGVNVYVECRNKLHKCVNDHFLSSQVGSGTKCVLLRKL